MSGKIHAKGSVPRRKKDLTRCGFRVPACADPRGVTELNDERAMILGDLVHRLGSKRVNFNMHRNRCAIVKEHDDEAQCTCRPLILYSGARA